MLIVPLMELPSATLWYYPEAKIIHHCFSCFPDFETFTRVLTAGARKLEETKTEKWLSDDRVNTLLPPEYIDWSGTVWRPRVLKAGWKFWALVLPENRLGQFGMRRLTGELAEHNLVVQTFRTPESALTWLEEQ